MLEHFRYFTNDLETVETTPKSKWDFSLVLKVCREYDDATSAGKLSHVFVPWRRETLGRRQWTVVYLNILKGGDGGDLIYRKCTQRSFHGKRRFF